jgi:hypothetical protein
MPITPRQSTQGVGYIFPVIRSWPHGQRSIVNESLAAAIMA